MNREDITRLAQEAGFVGMDGDHGALRRFATLVASAEREAIYNLVMEAPFKEQIETEPDYENQLFAMKAMAFSITSAIRARGDKHD
jgi:hypothetical protein